MHMHQLTMILILSLPSNAQAQAPLQAINACQGSQINSSCSFNGQRGKVIGSCIKPPGRSQLVCAPQRSNNRGQQQANQTRQGSQTNQIANRQGRQPRQHQIVQSNGSPDLINANTSPIAASYLQVSISGSQRILKANGISAHLTGAFPNRSNPNAIQTQSYTYRIPAQPQVAQKTTALGLHNFGIGINGVPFDPGAAEWFLGDRNGGWQYEALSGAIALGLDEGHAHVQPSGAYHYHGVPNLLLQQLDHNRQQAPSQHPSLIGWAADGFPIYALFGYDDGDNQQSQIIALQSSYQLKSGQRPSHGNNPGGNYDGTFTADYVYQVNSGNLDECNGRFTQTPDFPQGTYAYFLTPEFPSIPRCFKGTPDQSFITRPRR